VLYFVQPAGGGPIKIGTTGNLEARLQRLNAIFGVEWSLLGTMPGGWPEKRAIHRRFWHLALGCEQFRPARELLEFLGKPQLVGANPEAVEVISYPDARVNVQIDEDVVKPARLVATARGITLAEYISELLRPLVHRDFEAEMKTMLGGGETPPKPPAKPRRPKGGE
jgi:hypothetical protein